MLVIHLPLPSANCHINMKLYDRMLPNALFKGVMVLALLEVNRCCIGFARPGFGWLQGCLVAENKFFKKWGIAKRFGHEAKFSLFWQ